MNNHKRCADRREAIAELVMGAVASHETGELREHLETCEECRDLYQFLLDQEGQLQVAFQQLARMAEPQNVIARATARAATEACHVRPSRRNRFWTVPRLLQTAVAAAVIGMIALFAGSRLADRMGGDLFAGRAHAAYADMLQQIIKARSVAYTKTVQDEGDEPHVMQQMFLEGGRMRSEAANGFILIADYARCEQLALSPKKKHATLAHVVQEEQKRLVSFVDWIQTLHERKGVFAGRSQLDGRTVDVYRIDEPYEKITIWTDPITHLPVRLEKTLLVCTDKDIRVPLMELSTSDFADDPKAAATRPGGWVNMNISNGPGIREKKTKVTLSDFTWNTDLDESLFSLTPPPGYRVEEKHDFGDSRPDAQALVEALRFWAETSDGRFPGNINDLLDGKPNLVRKYRGTGTPEQAHLQAMPMMQTLMAAAVFAQQRKLEDTWHYAGRDVRMGEAEKALAWWLDRESHTWRVLYGDLSIKNLPAGESPPNLPVHGPPEPADEP